jgi:phosphoserine phosphatase
VSETLFLTFVGPANGNEIDFALDSSVQKSHYLSETSIGSINFEDVQAALSAAHVQIVSSAGKTIGRVFAVQHLLSSAQKIDQESLHQALRQATPTEFFLAKPIEATAKPRLVIMDVDSTVIQNEVIELLAARAGKMDEVKRITDAAMAGELDFEQSLRTRVETLAGLPTSVFREVYSEIAYTSGAKEMCEAFKQFGFELALVSGGFTEIVQWIASDLGIGHFQANQLEIVDNQLTGKVHGAVVDRAAKAEYLQSLVDRFGVDLRECVAIGDGANDLDMIALAGTGIAFNAKPVVQLLADVAINTEDLRAALFASGIPISFVD